VFQSRTMSLKHPLFIVSLIIFAASDALAQEAVQPTGPGVLMRMLPMFMMVFFIFWFMVLRPQERKIKAQAELLVNLKKGDEVITTGGLIGRVAGDGKDYILLDVGSNTKLRVEKVHVVKKYTVSEDGAKS
jgi:preprotein translocase subunit YajC